MGCWVCSMDERGEYHWAQKEKAKFSGAWYETVIRTSQEEINDGVPSQEEVWRAWMNMCREPHSSGLVKAAMHKDRDQGDIYMKSGRQYRQPKELSWPGRVAHSHRQVKNAIFHPPSLVGI